MGMSFGSCREVPATSEAVKLDDDRGQSVLKSLGFALDPIGGKKKPPHLQQILKQKGGVFLFEFHGTARLERRARRRATSTTSHVIGCEAV